MARRIPSQVIPPPAVRPVRPTTVEDVSKLIVQVIQAGSTAIGVTAQKFQQERQLGLAERQAEAAENRLEIAQVEQETLENNIANSQARLQSEEARVEIRQLKELEARGFQALVDRTKVDDLPALYKEFPLVDPRNQDAFRMLIGKRLASADQTNAMQRFTASISPLQRGATEIEGPPQPIQQNISDVVLSLIEERGIDDPRIRSVYEQELLGQLRRAGEGIVLQQQKLRTQELALAAEDENRNDIFGALDRFGAGEGSAEGMIDLVNRNFAMVNAANPGIDKTKYLDSFAVEVDRWAKSMDDQEAALAVVKQISNSGEQYNRRLRGVVADIEQGVKQQRARAETARVTDTVSIAEQFIREHGTEGDLSLQSLNALSKSVGDADIPKQEKAKLQSKIRQELSQVERSIGGIKTLNGIFEGTETGTVTDYVAGKFYKDTIELSPEARLVKLATFGQPMPKVAADDVETFIEQNASEGASILHALDGISSNAAGSLMNQMRDPLRARILLNTTRGINAGDRVYDQIIDAFDAPDAALHETAALNHLDGKLPRMIDAKGVEIAVEIGASAFPQTTLIERFGLSEAAAIKPSVIKDFEDHYVAGWMIANSDEAFIARTTTERVAFARSFAAKAIDRRYVLLPKEDDTSEFVRSDKLGIPISGAASEKQLSAIGTRIADAVHDQELQFGVELTADVDAIQIGEGVSWIPIGGMAVTEDAEGPQYVAFLELSHSTRQTRTISASTSREEFDAVRKLFGDESERLDPSVRLRWNSDLGSPVAGLNPTFRGAIAQDMINEGRKAWFDIVGGRPIIPTADFGTFMDSFLRNAGWQGTFPRDILLKIPSDEPLTGITLNLLPRALAASMTISRSPREQQIAQMLSRPPSPGQFSVLAGADITTLPEVMATILEQANGDPDLATKMAREAGWFVPEDDN